MERTKQQLEVENQQLKEQLQVSSWIIANLPPNTMYEISSKHKSCVKKGMYHIMTCIQCCFNYN